jgi:type II secretory pathway pseudopilin PulG
MKTLHSSSEKSRKRGGFTIVEILVATSVSMILLYGAIYSSMETVAVVSAGDTRINTQVHARRVLERLVKDCRYASELTVDGDQVDGWEIEMETGLGADPWTWTWDPNTETLTVSDGDSTETIVTGLVDFEIDTQSDSGGDIERISMIWTVREESGATGNSTGETTAIFPGSTWVRSNLP